MVHDIPDFSVDPGQSGFSQLGACIERNFLRTWLHLAFLSLWSEWDLQNSPRFLFWRPPAICFLWPSPVTHPFNILQLWSHWHLLWVHSLISGHLRDFLVTFSKSKSQHFLFYWFFTRAGDCADSARFIIPLFVLHVKTERFFSM